MKGGWQMAVVVGAGILCAGVARAEIYQCLINMTCDKPTVCAEVKADTPNLKVIERDDGLAFIDLGVGRIDMKELRGFGDARRDWSIVANPHYVGLFTYFANGQFVLSDHGQDAEGKPLLSIMSGTCEVER